MVKSAISRGPLRSRPTSLRHAGDYDDTTAPTANQAILWVPGTSKWTPKTVVLDSDARLSDTRTPADGTVTNAKVAAAAAIAESKLSLASDAAAGTASRRTLGTSSTSAAAGNHSHVAEGARRHRIGNIDPLPLGFTAVGFTNTTWTRGTAVTANTNNLTVNVAGVYLVGMVATFNHTNSGFRSTICQVNGVTAFEGGIKPGSIVRMPMTSPLVLAAGDVLTMQVYIDTAASLLQAGSQVEVGLSAIFLGT